MIDIHPDHGITIQPRTTAGCCEPVAPRINDAAARSGADLFKALADPARLQILDVLAQQAGQVCVCDFEGNVGLPDARTGQRPKQPTISHHLRVLREAGLIDCQKHGQWVFYFIVPHQRAVIDAALSLVH